jgi:hypothetical protein
MPSGASLSCSVPRHSPARTAARSTHRTRPLLCAASTLPAAAWHRLCSLASCHALTRQRQAFFSSKVLSLHHSWHALLLGLRSYGRNGSMHRNRWERWATAQLSPRNRLCPTTDWPGYPTIALLFPSRARGIITEFTHATGYSTLFSRGNLIGARKFTSLFTKLFFFHRKEKLVLQISPTRILFSRSLSVTGGISVTTARKGSRSKSVISCR